VLGQLLRERQHGAGSFRAGGPFDNLAVVFEAVDSGYLSQVNTRWTSQVLVGFFPTARPSPVNGWVGSTTSLSRPAQASLALRPARSQPTQRVDLCPEASTRPVARPSRSVASMSYRQLHRWNLPPLMICVPLGRTVNHVHKISPLSSQRWLITLSNGMQLQARKRRVRKIRTILRW